MTEDAPQYWSEKHLNQIDMWKLSTKHDTGLNSKRS